MTLGHRRGQLVIGAAILLAISFIATAIVLNGSLFVEYDSQSPNPVGAQEPVQFSNDAHETASSILDRTNGHNATNYSTLQATLSAEVDRWRQQYSRRHLARGTFVGVQLRHVTRGVRLEDRNRTRRLTAADGSSNWTLATNVSDIRALRFGLAANGSAGPTDPSPFRAVVDTRGATNAVSVTNNTTGGSTVTISNSTGEWTCGTTDDRIDISVIDGQVDGGECLPLKSLVDGNPPRTLRIENGENATGTFTATLANRTALQDATFSRGANPTHTPIAYRLHIRVEYENANVRYQTTRDVTP